MIFQHPTLWEQIGVAAGRYQRHPPRLGILGMDSDPVSSPTLTPSSDLGAQDAGPRSPPGGHGGHKQPQEPPQGSLGNLQ